MAPMAGKDEIRYEKPPSRIHQKKQPPAETNGNFGFNLPWWDRLLGTYRDQPREGHSNMTVGVRQFRDPERLTLAHLLAVPFVGDVSGYSFGRHLPAFSREETVKNGKHQESQGR